MSTPAHETAAALLRKQQRTTARLRVGLPALLAHLEQVDILPPEAPEPPDPVGPTPPGTREPASSPPPLDAAGGFDPFDGDPLPPLQPPAG
jgi:hypothetical protein